MVNFATKLAAVGAALFAAGIAGGQDGQRRLTISIDADFSSLDRQTNRGTFEGLRITVEQEDMVIEADMASVSGLDADRGKWELLGNVRVSVGTASLRADRATFSFGDQALISGELVGSPAVFEDRPGDAEDPVVGSAERIHYDNDEGIVRLEGGVSLTTGPNRITGCDVIYDLNQERVSSGTSACGQPFRITIIPPAEETSTSDTPVAP
jgi:lipopolysaccharide transport protein LptA